MDGLIGTLTGLVLIMFKNSRMKESIYSMIDKVVDSKSKILNKSNK